jgi:hypothetical protein
MVTGGAAQQQGSLHQLSRRCTDSRLCARMAAHLHELRQDV